MQRQISHFIFIIFIILLLAGTTSADIIRISDDIFYDDINGYYWYDNPSVFVTTDNAEQQQAIDNLSLTVDGVGIFEDWSLATNWEAYRMFYDNRLSGNIDRNWLEVFDYPDSWYTQNRDEDSLRHNIYANVAIDDNGYFGDNGVLVTLIEYNDEIFWDAILLNEVKANNPQYGAWIVHSAPTSPVPEPTTLLLLGTGLACLAGIGRKKKN